MSSLVGKKAPDFKANAVIKGQSIVSDYSLEQFIGKKNVIFFFYPMDFTFVCPTELFAFQEKLDEFEKRDTAVVGCSVDSEFSHWAWLNTDKKYGGIRGVNYPLVSDFSKTISQNFGVLAGEYEFDAFGKVIFNGNPVALRGLFLIDRKGIVRHELVNDLPLGRSIDEALRIVDALRHFEAYGEVCPANWQQGKEAMMGSTEGVVNYLSKQHYQIIIPSN